MPTLFCVKAQSKIRHFGVFIIISISQYGKTHIFLKGHVPMHQMEGRLVGGYRLDFSPTEQNTKYFILQALDSRWS